MIAISCRAGGGGVGEPERDAIRESDDSSTRPPRDQLQRGPEDERIPEMTSEPDVPQSVCYSFSASGGSLGKKKAVPRGDEDV